MSTTVTPDETTSSSTSPAAGPVDGAGALPVLAVDLVTAPSLLEGLAPLARGLEEAGIGALTLSDGGLHPIHVAAHWWQQRWAHVAAVLALLVLGYVAALARTRVLRAQREALEVRVAERTAELDAANARLLDLSYRDALTGLANRRRLLDTLERTPAGSLAALVFFDVDHFKELNDRHGHPAGDEVLRRIVEAMASRAPAGALLARYGGEEFACLLPGIDTATAADVAERMRAAVAAMTVQIPDGPQDARVSISAGVASRHLHAPEDRQRLLRDADIALYQAKDAGRNCVRISAG